MFVRDKRPLVHCVQFRMAPLSWWLAVNHPTTISRAATYPPLSTRLILGPRNHNGPLTVIGLIYYLCTSWYVMSYKLPMFLPSSNSCSASHQTVDPAGRHKYSRSFSTHRHSFYFIHFGIHRRNDLSPRSAWCRHHDSTPVALTSRQRQETTLYVRPGAWTG
jgi:hypothetical protein